MPQAKLTIDLPKTTWIHQVSTKYPESEFEVVAVMGMEKNGVGVVEITSERIEEILSDISEHDEIIDLSLLHTSEGAALIEFETTNPMIVMAAKKSGIPMEPPFKIRKGRLEWEITASHERLSELGKQLDSFGIPFDVNYVREIDSDRVLTERQEQVILAAIEEGYYDTPRETSLTELADSIGISKSTCSEILHRAEEKIIKRFTEELSEKRKKRKEEKAGTQR